MRLPPPEHAAATAALLMYCHLPLQAEIMGRGAALFMNINAAKGLHDVMKTNLGPKGTIKMLVGGAGGEPCRTTKLLELCTSAVLQELACTCSPAITCICAAHISELQVLYAAGMHNAALWLLDGM